MAVNRSNDAGGARTALREAMRVICTNIGVSNGFSHQNYLITKCPRSTVTYSHYNILYFAVHAFCVAFNVFRRTAVWREVSWCLLAADLVDLALEVVDYLGGYLVAEDLEQINTLIAGNRLVRRKFDALLNLLQ